MPGVLRTDDPTRVCMSHGAPLVGALPCKTKPARETTRSCCILWYSEVRGLLFKRAADEGNLG